MTSVKSINNRIRPAVLTLIAILTAIMPSTAGAADISAESDTVVASLIINSPGSDIYELEGHATIRIRTGDADYAVNYGIFDFN